MMNEERVSVVLRGNDLELFDKIKSRMVKTKGFQANTEVARYLMEFYLRNSPLFRESKNI